MATPPPSLSDQANTIMTLMVALKQDVDVRQNDPSKANDLVNAIEALRSTLARLLAIPGLAQSLGNAATRPAAFDAIENVISVEGGVSLSTFFKQVGSAVVEAQQALDIEFERDLQAMQTSPPLDRLTPVQYAIPSVHAEMKVGFSQVSSRGINLLVFNNSQQKQNYSESTISFDIVAAPAPPNVSRIPPVAQPEPLLPGGTAGPSTGGPSSSALPLEDTGAILPPRSTPPHAPADGADEGIRLESKRLPPRTASRAPSFEALPTFPLRGEARSGALAALEQKLAPANRRIVRDRARAVVIVPSALTPGARQTLLYLCPGARTTSASAAERAFRSYLAELSPAHEVSLRALRRPDAVSTRDLASRGIIVPATIGARDRSRLPDVIGGVGAILMQLVSSANACQPGCVLQAGVAEHAELLTDISRRLPEGVPALVEDGPWAVFVDRGKGPRGREYIVVRGVHAPATREWREVHVVGVSQNPRRTAPTPHIHIPDAKTIASWKGRQRADLDAVAAPLESLLRRLTTIVDANR